MSSLEVALTLVHEGIHAEIFRILLNVHGPSQVTNLNFPLLFKLYKKYSEAQGAQHEYIAQNYINIVATTLRSFDNNKYPLENYKALAWTGLEETDEYNLKTEAE